MKRSLFAALALLVVSMPLRAAEPADPDLAGLRERWAKAAKDIGVPGLAVVVVRGDRVVMLETFGDAVAPDGRKPVPLTPDSAFYIASCTKPYTATAILQLAEAGKIKLDEPVKTYLPKFDVGDENHNRSITIRDLLCHRPGLNSRVITFGEAYTGQWDDQMYWRLMPASERAGRVAYSNLHYTLLGRVIQSVTGQKWQDYQAEHVFAPAGMTRTTAYASKMYGWPDTAIPHIRDGQGRLRLSPVRKADSTMHAAGGLASSPHDLGLWLRMQLNDGSVNGKQVLSSQSIAEMQKLQAEVPEGERRGPPLEGYEAKGFGLAWNIADYRGHKICSHGGGYIGARAHVSFMPDENIGVAAMANIGDAAGPLVEMIAFDVYDRLLKVERDDLLPRLVEESRRDQAGREQRAKQSQPAQKPMTAAQLTLPVKAVAGRYRNADWGTIEVAADALRITWGELACEPTATSEKDRFQCHFERVARFNGRIETAGERVAAIVLTDAEDGTEIRFEPVEGG